LGSALKSKAHYVYYENKHLTPETYSTKLNGWGKSIHVFDQFAVENPTTLDNVADYRKALDAVDGQLPLNLTVRSKAYGNVVDFAKSPVNVRDLHVNLEKGKSTINPVKNGTTTNINNPKTVSSATLDSYKGLLENVTLPSYVGWQLQEADDKNVKVQSDGSVVVTTNPGETKNVSYARPFENKLQKLTAYASHTVDTGVQYLNYTGVYAVTAKNTWKDYDFAKDSDLSKLALNLGNMDFTSKNIVSQSVKNNDDGTQDVTAYFVSGTPSSARVGDDMTDLTFNSKTAYKNNGVSWLAWSGNNSLSIPIPKAENTQVTTDKLTRRDPDNPNSRSGKFTGSVANVVTADDPDNVKKYTETYTISDDKTKVSVKKGYGFTNTITLSADTYAGWGQSSEGARPSDTNASSVDIDKHKLLQQTNIDSDLLTQTKGLKATNDATLYDVTKNSQTETTKDTNMSDTAKTVTTNDLPLSKAHVDMQWEFANSWVRHGDNATQFFGSAVPDDKTDLLEVTNRQFLTPSDAKTDKTYNIEMKYGARVFHSLLFSNPSLDLTKTISVSNPSFPDKPDYPTISDTSFLVTTPDYSNPDVGDDSSTKVNVQKDKAKTSARYDFVKKFINSDN